VSHAVPHQLEGRRAIAIGVDPEPIRRTVKLRFQVVRPTAERGFAAKGKGADQEATNTKRLPSAPPPLKTAKSVMVSVPGVALENAK
jgi:hypothetical protein